MADERPVRGTPSDHMGRPHEFTFNALDGTEVPEFRVNNQIDDFAKNTIYVDLETTGLRTQSYNVLDTNPKRTQPGIMEIATFYREGGDEVAKPVSKLTGYSDVIPRDVLEGLTDEGVKALTEREVYGVGSRLDEGVLQNGKLREIFSDYVTAARTGKYSGTDIDAKFSGVKDYVKGFTELMEESSKGAAPAVLKGWNIGFDINVIMDTAKAIDVQDNSDYGVRIEKLLSEGKVEVKDLDEPLKKYIFHQAMTSKETAPENLSRKKINEKMKDGGRNVRQEIVDDVSKHGINGHSSRYVDEHSPLKKLGYDVRSHSRGKEDAFRKRLVKGLMEQRPMLSQIGEADNAVIDKVAQELSTIGKGVPDSEKYEAYMKAQNNLRVMMREGTSAEASLISDMVQGAYGDGHKSLLGELNHRGSHLPWQTLDNLNSALSYVGGRTQDIMAKLMGHGMAESAHVAMADIPMGSEMSARLETLVNSAIGGDQEAAAEMDRLVASAKNERFLEQTIEATRQEASQAASTAERVTAETVTEGGGLKSKLGRGWQNIGGWKGAAAFAAGGYLAYQLFGDSPHVEGVRGATSQHDQGHGIAPTGDPSLTPFGSGRDTSYQLFNIGIDAQKDDTRRLHRGALAAGRRELHAVVSPERYDGAQKARTGELRGMVERYAANKFVEKVILPEPPPPRPDQTLSYYDQYSQAEYSKNVQSNSHASIMEHPDHDHDRPGMIRRSMDTPLGGMVKPDKTAKPQRVKPSTGETSTPPMVKPSTGQIGSNGLSGVDNESTMPRENKRVDATPPIPAISRKSTGNSKVRDQGAKNFTTPPPVNTKTVNRSRHIRGN